MTETVTSESLAAVEDLADRRRSNLRVDPDRAVPPELVERLCRLAATAPNHKKTFPWRFRAVTGAARRALGEALATGLIEGGETDLAKLEKARTKYTRAPLVLVVGAAGADDPVVAAENRDAVAAAVGTLLLGATAAGLGSLWSTGAAARSPHVARLCGFDPGDTVVGLVYLGYPIADPPTPARPEPELRALGDVPTITG